jgi:hypothetical protein
MRLMTIFLVFLILVFAVAAAAEDLNGFRGFAWGSSLEGIQESDPKLVEGHMGTMPGVKAFQRRDDDLNFGGIKVDSITYIFYKGRLTSVSIDYKGFDNYEKLFAYCKKLFGPVNGTAVLRQEQYAGFDSPKTGAMLLYQMSMQTSNNGKLFLYSKEFMK